MTTLAPGQHIADRYRLDRRIAVGGMGEVWEASDTRLGRAVALKVLRSELSGDEEFLHRFRIEARTVASIDHSGIAAVHDYGEDDMSTDGRRTAYLVMELVRGEPLSSRISRGPIDAPETLRILEQAAWALDAAHQRGFVHRDVKPGNILLRVDGVVKLTDFGIAKAANAIPMTRSGMVMGTAHYIAPEQASGGEAGPAGDVYSLGIVGFECLAGHRPFRADNAVLVAMMQVRDEPPPLPDDVPAMVRHLIDAVLVKDPRCRYADGAEFARAIAAIRRGDPLPRPSGMPPSMPLPGSVADRGRRGAGDAVADPGDPLDPDDDEAGSVDAERAAGRRRGRRARSDGISAGPASGPSTGATSQDLTRTPSGSSTPGAGTRGPDMPGRGTPAGGSERAPSSSGSVVIPNTSDDTAERGTRAGVGGSGAWRTAADGTGARSVEATGGAPVRAREPSARTGSTALSGDPVPLRAGPRSHGSLLVVVFVVLTLAALALAVLVVPKLFGPDGPTGSLRGAPAGTVSGREAVQAGRAAGEHDLLALIVPATIR